MTYLIMPAEFKLMLEVYAAYAKTLTDDQRLAMKIDPMEVVTDLNGEEILGVTVRIRDVA